MHVAVVSELLRLLCHIDRNKLLQVLCILYSELNISDVKMILLQSATIDFFHFEMHWIKQLLLFICLFIYLFFIYY